MQSRFIIIPIMLGVLSCQKTTTASNSKDVKLRHTNGSASVVYSDGEIAFLRHCNNEAETISRTCPTPADMKPKAIPVRVYIKKLAEAFGVDEDIIRLGSVEKFTKLIEETKQLIAGGSLKPDELTKANAYLQRLMANSERSTTSINIVAKLTAGQELILNENFSNDFALIVSPFADQSTVPTGLRLIRDPNTGLVWTRLNDMCWYDAADMARVGGACRSDSSSLQNTVQLGCARTLGLAWSLPTPAQIYTTSQGPAGALPTWDRFGSHYYYDRRYNGNWSTGFTGYDYITFDSKLKIAVTICVAKASDIEPDGDIDGDGITNSQDKCNRLPDNRTSPVEFSGPRMGCAQGQKTDWELGDSLVGDGAIRSGNGSSVIPYDSSVASRYITRTSPPAACTTSSGNSGTHVYTGKWDPEALSQDGTRGAWISAPYSGWTNCQ